MMRSLETAESRPGRAGVVMPELLSCLDINGDMDGVVLAL